MDGDRHCYNLVIHSAPGMPGATTCRVHAARYLGMPIMLVSNNAVVALGTCAHGSPQDEIEIIKKGIGKGCSLKLVS